MPCYYTGSAAGDAELEHGETQQALTHVTRMLCDLCEAVEDHDGEQSTLLSSSPSLSKWWADHKQIDQQRRNREKQDRECKALQQSAIKKLTAEERRALGL